MNLGLIGGATAMAAVAAWHFGGGPSRPVYDIPIETAEARLKAMSFEDGMLTGQPFDLSTTGDGGARRLSWAFGARRDGASSGCTIRLEADGAKRTASDLRCAVSGRRVKPEQAELPRSCSSW
jgi:hypothetical protein